MRNNENHIFVDTNCIITYLVDKYGLLASADPLNTCALHFLRSRNGKKLFLSSLTIAQVTAKLQPKIGAENMSDEIKDLLRYFQIVEFNEKDIMAALTNPLSKDIEDLYQYEMSQKVKCFYIMTKNTKDFSALANIVAFAPNKVRKIIF